MTKAPSATPTIPTQPRSLEPRADGALLSFIPEEDRWALDPQERESRLEEEMARRLRLSRFLLQPEKQADRDEFAEKCRRDPAFFFKHVLWTKDPERNMHSTLVEVPLIPYRYVLEPVPYRGGTAGGWLKRWTEALQGHVPGRKVRLLEEKTRRTLLSITCCGFILWGMRFFPGFHAWLSSDNEEAIDHGENWDALFPKIRYMWGKAHEFYPWLFPELPGVGKTSINKDRYIEFPKWTIGSMDVAKECWGNKIRGLTPNEVSGRGGAALFGFIDEAGWIESLDAFLDNIEQMTAFLILASTPPEDSEHPFAKRAQGEFGYDVSSVHWVLNPAMASGLYWDEAGDLRGPHTQKWRSPFYDSILSTQPTHVVARNYDLDYRAVAGSRVLIGWAPRSSPTAPPDTDLYDPSWPLEIWYDVGRRDPWACLWVQVSDATGEVRIVDYWMRAGVTVEWWLPIWLGWNPDQMASWRTYPDMRKWKDVVPWSYGAEDIELMRRWHRRFGARPDAGEFTPWNSRRPVRLVQDAFGLSHNSSGAESVADIVSRYGIPLVSSTTVHHLEKWIEHANSVLVRTFITPRVMEMQPTSGGTRYPRLPDSLLSWRWLPSTPREQKPRPAHDIHSHACTAFIFGAMQLPAKAAHADLVASGRIQRRRCFQVSRAPGRDRAENITGIPAGMTF